MELSASENAERAQDDDQPADLPFQLHLFGPFELRIHGETIPRLRTRKAQWLLALLVLRRGAIIERDRLSAMLWPESPESQGLYNLRRSLVDLRHALGPEAWRLQPPSTHTLSLDLAGAWCDVLVFDDGVAGGDPEGCAASVALYRGALLEGCLEEWALPEREARQETYLCARDVLAGVAMAHQDYAAAAEHARLAIRCDPWREPAYRTRMAALTNSGDYGSAVLTYHDLRRFLQRELNTDPSPESRALFHQIRAEARQAGKDSLIVARHTEGRESGVGELTPGDNRASVADDLLSHDSQKLEPIGGAVPLESSYYLERPADRQLAEAIRRGDSIVLIKGARQMGKTSLLARGLHQARELGARVVRSDLSRLAAADLVSAEALLRKLAASVAHQLNLEVFPEDVWRSRLGPVENFEEYWRGQVLASVDTPVVWGLDEVDRVLPRPFASEVFALFRSWHNERAMDPGGPWMRLTLVIAYATEAELFITDINQSPFAVGTRLLLEDFTPGEVADLNQRYGAPLQDDREIQRYYRLVGGHPYLVRRGLHEMASQGLSLADVESQDHRDGGIFGNHLRTLLALVTRDSQLAESVRRILQGHPCASLESFHQLCSAGVMSGHSTQDLHPRCGLYASYLSRHLL